MRWFLIQAVLFLAAVSASSDDWPTYLHDAARSGVTTEQLPAGLRPVWAYKPAFKPAPAWPAPANQDIWHEIRELRPIVTYDRAFHAVTAAGSLLFGSSSEDRVYCLDAATGSVRWTFSCEGPVRLAPTVWNGKAYFGSDDGYAYCVQVSDGALVWKHRPADQDRRLPGNGRIMSLAPVRTGVTVDGGVAYFCAGLFPPDDVYRCALDAETGAVLWQAKDPEASPQGYMLASPTRLFVPTGRTAPFMYDRATGNLLGPMAGPGGAYALLVDDTVVSGPGRRGGLELEIAAQPKDEGVASFPCVRMVVSGGTAYLQGKDSLRALNRSDYVRLAVEQRAVQKRLEETVKARDQALHQKDSVAMKQKAEEAKGLEQQVAALGQQMEACFTWTREDAEPYALILAGDTLYSGGSGKVTAMRAADGQPAWSAEVDGNIYGLSAANGRLYASSDTGTVYCFGADAEIAAPAATPAAPFTAEHADRARDIVEQGGFHRGYCLMLGFDDAPGAIGIAQASELSVVMAVQDEGRAAALRDEFLAAGLAPSRATAQFVAGPELPYAPYMFNVVVVAGPAAVSAPELHRVLRPYGGTALVLGDKKDVEQWRKTADLTQLTWSREGVFAVARRGAVEGAGEWTQLYATPGHTACSGETLEGPLGIQWFGEPGPRDIVDRHHRPMSSLFKDGRLFVMGNEKVFSVDPYNGTVFWTLDVPDSRRVGSLKNSGQALLTEDRLYIAVKGECWVVDVADGKRLATFTVPNDKEKADWGDLNCVGDRLFGTGQKSGASFNVLSRQTIDMLEGDFRPVVTSNYVFCLDRHTGKQKWTYRNGAVMNNTVTIAGDRMLLVENRAEDVIKREDGRVRVDVFCRDAYLVALNLKNGKKVWERPVQLPFQHIMYLSASGDTALATGSYNEDGRVYYGLFAYDADSGKDKWATSYQALDVRGQKPAEPGGTHGEQWQHPVIIGDTVYSRPYAFDLKTGEKKDYIAYRGGHGCGGLTGSANYLFGRGSNPRMYPTDVASTEGIPLTLVSRPGCWLNIIPAGGLVMIPESSSGCTCAYPMQMSVVLAPQQK